MVRIAVLTGQQRARLSGPGLSVQPLAEGRERAAAAGGEAEASLAGGELAVDGALAGAPAAVFRAEGPIRLGALSLPGEVEVRLGTTGLDVILALPMEDYVAAVVEAEMPLAFPPEALKAQAVAARSFALYRKLEALAEGRSWHLGATVLDQVYRGGRDPRARASVAATAGEVLALDHEPVQAFFHSACGGRTEGGGDALGKELPYLAPVRCTRCQKAPRWRWTATMDAGELGRLVGLGGPVTSARVAARSATGRAAAVAFAGGKGKVQLAGADLRQRLGWDRLPSLAFDVHLGRGGVRFEGSGSGHGAGLCQWGAAGYAREGRDYRTILAHYYRGAEVVRMY
ncbi:MAG: SpoIID/LytB domain-containing protein [Deltaproteobacteria bacterium]|nr:SpoIID/LytB domain-containing protein [Deltaproteobacteria bacterium]